jgi:leucyl-tRNA---protein transferase
VNGKSTIDPFGDFEVEWSVTPARMDEYWARGWRHFGPFFFRRYLMEYEDQILAVQPLRVVIERFAPSKSQRRVLRKNADLTVRVKPTALDETLRRMFAAHVLRFTHNIPPTLESFLGDQPSSVPCENVTVSAYLGARLIAASFLDAGREGVSSVYAIFDPAESWRSLGIYTMLKEIEYARERGCQFYYPGYACHESSPYDYKKQFAGLEWFDWQGRWRPLARSGNSSGEHEA